MKKVLFLGLALLVFTANVFAKGQVSLWGGYTTVCMKDVNNMFRLEKEKQKKLVEKREPIEKERGLEEFKNSLLYLEDYEVSKAKDAFIVGVDYLFSIGKTVKIGPRVAFLQIKKAALEASYSLSLSQEPDDAIDWLESASLEARLVPIMFGGSYNINISKKFSLILKLFLGYGLIDSKFSSHILKVGSSIPEIVKDYGEQEFLRKIRQNPEVNEKLNASGCFVADISVGTQYLFTERFGLELGIGYRFTPETQTTSEGEKAFKLDFSGLTTKLSLSYKI